MEIVPKVEYETNEAGQIVKVKNDTAVIDVKWNATAPSLFLTLISL